MKYFLLPFLILFFYQANAENNIAPQDLVGTLSVKFDELTASGKITGCSLNFQVLHRDFIYTRGEFYYVEGHISVMELANKGVAGLFKFGLNPVFNKGDYALIDFAYLKADKFDTSKSKFESFIPHNGFKTFAYSFSDKEFMNVFGTMLGQNNVSIYYNLVDGTLDTHFDIDLNIWDTNMNNGKQIRKASTSAEFLKCIKSLVD